MTVREPILPERVLSGSRNHTLARFAGVMRREGAGPSVIFASLKALRDNGQIETSRDDPMTDRELRDIAVSIGGMRSEAVEQAWSTEGIRQTVYSVPLSDITAEAPKPLRLGFLDPDDATVLYGDGGTGKGVLAASWAAALSRDGEIVLILDYEAHARTEWRPRVEAFGGDLERVRISQPKIAIWDAADDIAAEAASVGATWVFVDSVAYACLGLEVEKSATAIRYSAAITRLGLPTLSLAHTTKADGDQRHPFGSVFWSNGARVTISMTGRGDAPRVLENRKTNQRAPFAPVSIDWSWSSTGKLPGSLAESQHAVGIADRAHAALAPNLRLTVEEIRAAINADGGPTVTLTGVRNALKREAQRAQSRFRSDGRKPARWSRAIVLNRVAGSTATAEGPDV